MNQIKLRVSSAILVIQSEPKKRETRCRRGGGGVYRVTFHFLLHFNRFSFRIYKKTFFVLKGFRQWNSILFSCNTESLCIVDINDRDDKWTGMLPVKNLATARPIHLFLLPVLYHLLPVLYQQSGWRINSYWYINGLSENILSSSTKIKFFHHA